MSDILNTVLGKVFIHPVTKEGYGQIRLPLSPTNFSTLDGTSFDVLAEDDCGNCFTTREDGSVWFWDHETDDLVRVASSVSDFVAHCIDPPPVELDPTRVKSVWIDPTFAKSIGREVPEDGWIKKPSKPK
jgi:hypothetical protein